MSSRPRCAYCRKRYGRRAIRVEHLIVEIGKPFPPPKMNIAIMREDYYPPLPPVGPATPEEATEFVMMDRSSVIWYTGRKGRSLTRIFWDGESYVGGHDPFCTSKCAEAFAKEAYQAGYRISGKNDD